MTGTTLGVRLSSEGLDDVTSWSNGPRDRYPEHRHGYDKVLVTAVGSITFTLPELGQVVELRPGDRLDLPADTLHAAEVGPDGVTCLEAHLQRGRLDPEPRHLLQWGASEAEADLLG